MQAQRLHFNKITYAAQKKKNTRQGQSLSQFAESTMCLCYTVTLTVVKCMSYHESLYLTTTLAVREVLRVFSPLHETRIPHNM